ncbi:enoyl-CoA hydratase/isomerase family protein [Parafrankia sp. EUN1f]|uniref:enoyl-CoA hydratase/isomerase family protein n=1 Tax=Parafrankia sp. EUN1f TaxID=102897 RepID=UPI0001C46821|nr:enoyl-CoA hydratase/isomerase family protein [Parafrankia sp. EUN1f]EFC80936.1 Enoyl-CoA hydratase/isomerase [Parafrankia sp. EUN1f]
MGEHASPGPELRQDGELLILDLGSDQNLFDGNRVAWINSLLDEVEQARTPRALITTASGKHWCNGADIGWIFGIGESGLESFAADVLRLYARFVSLPMISVAALQGHAFANGVMLALAHDYRLMQRGRGRMGLPYADAGFFYTWGEISLLRAKLPPFTALEMTTTSRTYDAETAAERGLVDLAVRDEPVLTAATEFARPMAYKNAGVIEALKRHLFADALEALCGPRATDTGRDRYEQARASLGRW